MRIFCTSMLYVVMMYSSHVCAETLDDSVDEYSNCIDQTIKSFGLENINNAVVEICSHQTKELYQAQIVKLLDQIKIQSIAEHQLERYNAIMKSQQLWKNYVDVECHNAGAYIGSPMYEFCPMMEYGNRVEQLKQYVN